MKKKLSEMTLGELWELFPIVLKEHNPEYKNWYEIEKKIIIDNIKPQDVFRINHIGSSAVEGLIAKPIVDILLEIDGCCNVTQLIKSLESLGWTLMLQECDPVKLAFNKGYTTAGFAEKVYHLHVRYLGNWDELYFRDLLALRPDVATEYGKLKLNICKQFEFDRDGYTAEKFDFVLRYSNIAKCEFKDKYKPMV